jgi:hypothetical protein
MSSAAASKSQILRDLENYARVIKLCQRREAFKSIDILDTMWYNSAMVRYEWGSHRVVLRYYRFVAVLHQVWAIACAYCQDVVEQLCVLVDGDYP